MCMRGSWLKPAASDGKPSERYINYFCSRYNLQHSLTMQSTIKSRVLGFSRIINWFSFYSLLFLLIGAQFVSSNEIYTGANEIQPMDTEETVFKPLLSKSEIRKRLHWSNGRENRIRAWTPLAQPSFSFSGDMQLLSQLRRMVSHENPLAMYG